MITLSTDYKVIYSEMQNERPKALYWLRKKLGGYKAYDDEMERVKYAARVHGSNQRSEIYTYTSPMGNKWIMFIQAFKTKSAGEVQVTTVSFCMYETFGSVGIFLPIYDPSSQNSGIKGCAIFTSHFFLRASERLGFAYTSEQCLANFITFSSSMSLCFHPKDGDGRTPIDVRIPGAVGRGYMVSRDPLVVEVRTCLRDDMLSRKQQKSVDPLMKFDQVAEYVTTESILNQSIRDPEGALQSSLDRRKSFQMAGGNVKIFDFMWMLHAMTFMYMSRKGFRAIEFYERHYDFTDVLYRLDKEYIERFVDSKSTDKTVGYMCEYIRRYMKTLKYSGYDAGECEKFIRHDYGLSAEVLDDACMLSW